MAEPLQDRIALEKAYNFTPNTGVADIPQLPFKGLDNTLPTVDGQSTPSALSALENHLLSTPPKRGPLTGGSISRSLAEVTSNRYNVFVPGDYNNEDAYAQGQGWTNKMINGVGKGLLLTGTTFLQSTIGLVNGVARWTENGRAASFYDNEFNRALDELNKKSEDVLPNYYKDVERTSRWYSPTKLFTGNFFWDGIVKNLGFAAGAALSGGVYASALKALPLTSRLFSVGKAAETLAATEQGILAANKVADTYGKVKSLSDKFLQSYSVLNPAGRAVVAGLATTGEAGFEAYHNLNQFRDEKIQEYKTLHNGQSPIGGDLDKINAEADNVGNSSFMLNTGLLSATNYIQFPKILGSSYKAEKGMLNSLKSDISGITKDASGKFIRAEAKTRTGRLLSKINNIRPYTFSASEGFEEGAQFAISVGTQDYYNKKYDGDVASFLDSMSQGVGQTLGTDEGMENVLIGGLSGAIMLGRSKFLESAQKSKNTADAIQKFNKWNISDFTKDTIDSVNRGTVLQEEREALLRQGDILESKEKEADYIINYLTPRIKYGRFDLVKQDISDYKQLAATEEGFAQLQAEGKVLEGDTREAYIQRLTNLEETAENMKSLYQSLVLRYGNLIMPDGSPVYSPEVMDKMIYSATKVADYDKRLPDLSISLMEKGVDTSLLAEDVLAGKSESFNAALKSISELKVTSDVKEDLVEQLKDFSELSLRRQKFLEEYDEIKRSPENFKSMAIPETKETVSVKTKDGEEEITIGEEYFLGKVTEFDENGKEIYRFPKLTIIAQNPDGTIKIKDSNGNVKDVSKAVLEDYKLGKVVDTLSNKKAKFFMDHANTMFEFNFGKGKKQKGRLEYSSKDRVLNFVYKGKDGKIKRIEVTGDQFVVKEGFSAPMIEAVGQLSPAQQKTLADFAAEKDARIADKKASRLKILNDLFDDISNRHEKTKKLIYQKQTEVKNIQEELSDLEEIIKNAEFDARSKKALRFRAQGKKALDAAIRLSRTKDQLEAEILTLEAEVEELEFNASYIADLSQNIDELPTDSKEFLEELKDQKSLLEDVILETGKNINSISKLIDNVQSALDSAIAFLKDLVGLFEKAYPKAPLAIGQEWVDFLKDNPNFLKRRLNVNYKEDLKYVEDLVAQVEDLDIVPNERTINELQAELKALQTALEQTEKEIKAKDAILSKFEEVAKNYKVQKEQEITIAHNQSLLQQFLGTHTNDIENNVSEGGYQPEKKKDDNAVINGTVAVDDGKPHQKRANTFGINFPNLKNKDKLRVLEITAKTEAKAGIPGLIEHLITGTTIDKNTVVAVVFVQDDGNDKFSFVDENGEVIKTNLIDKAIYQVRPREVLELNYGNGQETMFRDSTPKETQEELKKRYAAHREFVLSSEALQPMKEFNASFGILQYEQKSNDKGQLVDNFGAENSVLSVGLVTEDDFAEKENLLEVSTLNDPTPENGVSFKNFIGRVLLRIPGVGMLKLNTTKLGKEKAENIYSAILQVAKNVNEDPKNGNKKSEPLFAWLKTVVYWGIPKNLKTGERTEPTYNNVWFDEAEDETTRLFVSGKGGNFMFTPSALETNKAQIIMLLENMYHNVSNSELKKGLKKYRELTGFDKEGAPEYKTWENYQTYLVSEKAVTTPVLAVKGDEQNREGIYFVLQNSLESEVEKPVPKEQPKQEGLQTYTSPEGKKINYLLEDGNVILKPGADLAEVMQKVKPVAIANNPGKTSEEVKEIVVDSIQNRIKDSLPKEEVKPKRSIFGNKSVEPIEQKPAKVELETPPPAGPPRRSIFNMSKPASTADEVYRLQVAQETNQFEGEIWKSVETWLKANFPNIPVYRVKNAIEATNGRQAWGMLHKGAIYLSQKAEIGTAYHEVFEAVWKMLSPRIEQENVLEEFHNRKGTFVNKFTGETVKYSEASYLDAKEQLAEEFRDYILSGKIPAKPTTGKSFIVKLFADIYNFFKVFFTGEKAQINTANLFSKIGNGYYKNIIPYESGLSFAKNGIIDVDDVVGDETSDFRLQNVPYVQKHELMQHMTYSTLAELIKNNASLFGVSKLNKKDLYSFLKDEILSLSVDAPGILQKKASALQQNLEEGITTKDTTEKSLDTLTSLHESISSQWDKLVEEHTIYLKQYSIEFDENDNVIINDENKDKGADGYADARKVDYFRKANPAVKMLLATIPQVQIIENKIGFKRTSIGGISTLPLDKTFITLKNKLYNSLDVEDMMSKLRNIAKEDPNYSTLYKRLTKESAEGDDKINFLKLTDQHDIELLSSFYKAMKAQKPDVKIVYMLPSGEVEIGDAHLADATRQAKTDMFGDIVSKLKSKSPYISFDKKEKEYNATDVIKKLVLKPGNKDAYIAFLKAIGVDFTKQELNTLERRGQYKAFEDAVNGVKASIESIAKVKDLNKYTINLEGRLGALGALRAVLTNPDFESTYFSISGERTQTYIGTNSVSDFYDVISRIDNIKQLSNTPYAFLLTDEFAKNSVILNSIFNSKTGNKKEGSKDILATGILEGIVDTPKGKTKDSSNVTAKDRLVEELNLNHEGWFLNLVPGDASIEWMVKMFNNKRPFVSASDLETGYNEESIFGIFRDYFISELNTAREDRTIPAVKGRNSSDLRFFKPILGQELHDKIVKNTKDSALSAYNKNSTSINNAVKEFVKKEAKDVFIHLNQYGVVKYGAEGMEVENLSFAEEGISEEKLILELEASQANYMIANIELHKLIYSDPYFYKDELKRIKNFNSPAQPLMSSTTVNRAISTVYNKRFNKGTLGWTNFNVNFLVSATIADVSSFIKDLKGYEEWEETDGGGMITQQAYRNVRIRAANWNDQEERQYIHDIGYEKLFKSGATKEDLEEFDKKNPSIKSAYTPIKPIVRGSKTNGKPYNDILLDKFALTPLSFRILHKINPDSNVIKHYEKMLNTGVDYTVFKTGRKVGAEFENPLYNEDGSYNTSPFLETAEIPFSIISIQTEVPSKDKPEVTQGSQVTKLATMDFLDAGVPLDFEASGKIEDRFAKWTLLSEGQKEKISPLYKLIKHNETLLVERIQHGYSTLLNKLGIEQKGNFFKIKDIDKLIETLTDEVYKREVNDNIIEAFKGFKSGQVVLEATPAYQQIRNILYSIANKQVTRPTISGGLKVQIPSTLLESTRPVGKKGMYESDILKFYEDKDGQRIAEIMVGRWFKSDLSDKELLKYLNETEEGKKILSGVGFRIPTQKQNSIDVFRIKEFLPSEFGDSVVIPSALVKKVGSDFDIDKLSLYFKNTYINLKGKLKIVPFFGYGEKAKAKFAEMYDDGEFLKEKDRNIVNKWIRNRKKEDKDEVVENLFKAMFGEEQFDDTYVQETIDDFLDSHSTEEFKQKVINEKYKQSLENEYIQSLEDLVSHPLNYEKLISPNSADQLKKLSKDIVKKLGFEEIDYTSVGNMLDRNFMERLRQAFVRGKYAIGIAATSQTNNAQNQRTVMTIDYDKLDKQSPNDQKWLGDGVIKFKQFNKINNKPTLSLAKNAKGQLISDIIGQFIDGYVDVSKGPWIMELGATPNTASTWLFLIKLGVPIDTVAYFMNQPIVREHLSSIENAGYSWVFNDTIANQVREEYSSNVKIDTDLLPPETELEKMVGKKELSQKEKAQQLFILDEFLKYSKLAEQLFHIQQGSNFDTANINDPYIAFKKRMQLEKARTMMISSVDDLLNNSFVGKLKDTIFDIRDAFSTILISDKPGTVRNTLEQVLFPYIESNDRDFVKISQKAVFDLFDWAVQTNQELNSKLSTILLGKEDRETAADEIMSFIKSVKDDKNHPLNGNYIIESLKQTRDSVQENKPHNLYVTGKNNKIYDQNNVIYGFSEIRSYLEGQGELSLYTKLIDLAVLQSGLTNSKISFTSLLPYEDFKDIYNETLSVLDKMTNLQEFVSLNILERNNWNNPDIVSSKKSQWLKLKEPFTDFQTGQPKQWIKVPEIEFLNKNLSKAVKLGKIPQVIQISPFTKEGREEFINFTWEKDISKQKKQEMRKKGDYSYIQKGLFKKVYDENGLPLISTYTSKKTGKQYNSIIFKAVNAWGDSFRANEFYTTPQQSIIDNGFIKVNEVSDTEVENAIFPKKQAVSEGTDQIPKCI